MCTSVHEYRQTASGVFDLDVACLVAMKLRSGRQYKKDLSDVLGILAEHEKLGDQITMERIRKAVRDLYGDWNVIPEASRNFITNVTSDGHFEMSYKQTLVGEKETRELLIGFEESYPGVTKESNVDKIAENLQKKTDRASVLAKLREKQQEVRQREETANKPKVRSGLVR